MAKRDPNMLLKPIPRSVAYTKSNLRTKSIQRNRRRWKLSRVCCRFCVFFSNSIGIGVGRFVANAVEQLNGKRFMSFPQYRTNRIQDQDEKLRSLRLYNKCEHTHTHTYTDNDVSSAHSRAHSRTNTFAQHWRVWSRKDKKCQGIMCVRSFLCWLLVSCVPCGSWRIRCTPVVERQIIIESFTCAWFLRTQWAFIGLPDVHSVSKCFFAFSPVSSHGGMRSEFPSPEGIF